MLKYQKGDLFNSNATILAHGVNCRGGFGKGVAAQMAKLHPKARNSYLTKHKRKGWELGDVQFVLSKGKIIANCATQDKYWEAGPKTVLVEYWAIRSCMVKIASFASVRKMSVALPRIGAGLAGGDWDKIKKILEKEFVNINAKVYEL